MRYAVVIEKAAGNYSAYVPDLPGRVAVGDTLEEMEQMIREAIAFHLNYGDTWLFRAMLDHPLLGGFLGGAPTWGAVVLLIRMMRFDNFPDGTNANA